MQSNSNTSSLTNLRDRLLFNYRERLLISIALILSLVAVIPYKAFASTAAAPKYSPASAGYDTIQTITISDSTSGAVIYYTTNGTTPTTKSTKYTKPITVSASTNFQAVAQVSGGSLSPVTKAWYTITLPAATPVVSPAPGTYYSIQSVTLKCSTPGSTIRYTLDGTYPTTSSPLYTGPIKATKTTSIIATAFAPHFNQGSAVRARYLIKTPPPSISPESGTYTDTTKVTMTDAVPGATIYYTKDGSTPTTSSTVYKGPITISPSRTTTEVYQALAYSPGYYESNPTIATFTVTMPAGVVASTYINRTPKLTIPPNFLGLSMYWNFPSGVIGQASTGANLPYRTLLKNLTQYFTAPMLIRVLGDDSENSDIQADVEPLVELSQAVNVNFLLGVDLWHKNLSLGEEEASTWMNGIPNDLIEAFEIGNEPNVYPVNGARPTSYDFAEYLPQYQEWRSGVLSSTNSKFHVMGPSYGAEDAWVRTAWIASTQSALASKAMNPGIVSQHSYVNGPGNYPSDYLLEPSSATGLLNDYSLYAASAHKAGSVFRLGEMNSFWGNGGVEGISNSFSSALWSIDMMFGAANVGIDGVNWHSGQGVSYQLFQFYDHNSGGAHTFTATQVNPLYYGLLVFAQMAGRGAKLLPVTTSTDANISVWATVDNTSTTHVVVINKDEKATGDIHIFLSGYTKGVVRYLSAASYTATNGVTLGGQTFDETTDGTLSGHLVTTTITADDGKFTLPNMPITSAAIIDFSE